MASAPTSRQAPVRLLLAAACSFPAIRRPVPLDPATAADSTWDRLRALENFRFRLRYHTDSPFELGSEFTGVWQRPDRESWSGRWWRSGEGSGLRLVGSGDQQYEREDGTWERTARGHETRLLEQVQHVLQGASPELGEDAGRLVYDFTPKVRFLDPAGTKRFAGRLEVEKTYGLPVLLYCADEGRTAEWELEVGSYNRAGGVAVPFVAETEVELAPAGPMGRSELGRAVGEVRARLERLGWDYRLDRVRGRLVLALDRELPERELGLLAGPGSVELWWAGWVEEPVGESVVEVAGDAASRARLARRAGGNGDFEVTVRAGAMPEPLLAFGWEATAEPAGEVLVLLVDGAALAATPATVPGSVEFPGVGGERYSRVLASVARGRASAGLRVAARR